MRDHGHMTDRHQHLAVCARALGASMIGPLIATPSSLLVPVSLSDDPSALPPTARLRVAASRPTFLTPGSTWMLKVAFGAEERTGLEVQWQLSDSMVQCVLLGHSTVAENPYSYALLELGVPAVQRSFDVAAVSELCRAAHEFHRPRPSTDEVVMGTLTPLDQRFHSLLEFPLSTEVGAVWARYCSEWDGVLDRARTDVRNLLAHPLNAVVLHGDVHHGNLIQVTRRGIPQCLLTDPKGVVGESLFDYANMLFNPDVSDGRTAKLFDERVDLVVQHLSSVDVPGLLTPADVEARYLRWVRAYGCLSAVWSLEDNLDELQRENAPNVPEAPEVQLLLAGIRSTLGIAGQADKRSAKY